MTTKDKEEQALVVRMVPKQPTKEDAEVSGIEAIVEHNRMLMALVEKMVGFQTASFADVATERQNMFLIMNEFAKTHLDNIKEREVLLDKKQDRKLRLEKERAHLEFMASLGEDIKALAPHIAEKFLGKKALTEPESVQLKAVLGSLSPTEIDGMLAAVSPAKRAVIQNLILAMPEEPRGPMRSPEKEDSDDDTENGESSDD